MKAYAAEFVGTFVLVLGGCGAAVLAADHIGYAGVAFAFGLSLLGMIYAIGRSTHRSVPSPWRRLSVYGLVGLNDALGIRIPYSRSGRLDPVGLLGFASSADAGSSRCTGSDIAAPL